MTAQKYYQYAFFLWIYTLIVILWGAWVRISRSGDGCGQNWPLCHGQILPLSQNTATWIEFSHRVSTGIFGLAVIVLVIMAFQYFPTSHRIRKASLWTLFFTLTEALIGAKLVLSGLVGEVSSLERALVMSIHQINSLLLTGSLVMSFQKPDQSTENQVFFHNKFFKIKSLILQAGFLLLAILGAISALSSTLFPSQSLIEGFYNDFQTDVHWLIKWRIVHPVFAVIYISISLFLISSFQNTQGKNTLINKLFLLYVATFIVGLANILTLSPTIFKLMHLGLVHILWSYLLYFLYLTVPAHKPLSNL